MPTFTAQAVQAPVGQGFTVTPSDLSYILKQIKIAEAHSASLTVANPCGTLVGTGPNQLESPLLAFGLRTVDGSCNNLQPGQEKFGAADQTFPRLGSKSFRDADPVPPGFGPPGATSYKQTKGLVFDAEPRLVSNLVVDQTSTNPAAIAAAGFPVRTQGNAGVVPCITEPTAAAPGLPAGCVPAHKTLFIPNVTTDVGLSPPYNSLFTLFGQFFDHGIDQTVKGGGTVFVPMKADDPLIAGPDHIFGNDDDLDPNLRFMVLTRGQNQPGPDGVLGTLDDVQDATNTDSPWVDQSQTYTSHPSHQVFVREYANNTAGKPVSTGKLLGGPAGPTAGGMASWTETKAQAATLLGLKLVDTDVTNIPMLATDPYGKFIPGARGLPQYVTATGLVEGCRTADAPACSGPVAPPANVRHFDTPFLTDIAHNADPGTVGTCTTAIGVTPRVPTGCLTPDADTTASADFASQVPGTYDDEMLNKHFICGDGRCNENIGLTTIHQIFHSEHDRLVDYVKGVLTGDTSLSGVAALAEWKSADGAAGWNGERLFQAARFVTEMEYQHLVFEEFARKVQPAINPFEPFAFTQTDINPAIKAEFAHAVYRFGHSMLTEKISRTNENGSKNDISLLDGFLNPPSYTDGGSAGPLTSEEAAGSVIMGMSDQVGNELDEFVTDTLRNNLLGLPLDLPTINMARARSEGVPPLNVFRSDLFSATNDAQLKPYISWVDFGENLKHPESLVNFVAAYGTHPSISAAPNTLASRREAARLIVSPDLLAGDVPPSDAAAFMNSSGTTSGLDSVDLWVGGLAEKTNPFGGLLGTTFNYVFEKQLTDLQNGDRLYYLARTPGMNLRTQLEGNSFAELVMRNTNAHSLKADAFATADCKFELKNLAGTTAGFAASGNTVADDPTSQCNETALLIRMPDGTIKYRSVNSVDPPGINGQAVYNGTDATDHIFGGNDNDTFWGGLGNDVIEGGSGADIALGGEGDDIITDLGGDDVPKGGPGNDAINAGPGLDIVMGGEGKDFTNGGANANETFGGAGDDFIILGEGLDAAFGDSGNDWEEGGDQADLMQGDSGNLFFLDNAQKPGSDILIGQGGDDDYDMEGGNDIGVSGPGVEKVAGASGYDWEIGLGDPQPQDMDLNIPLIPLDILQVGVRDKFNEVEALSGANLNDTLRGDSITPAAVGGGGFIGCDVLDQAGLDLIDGLDPLVPTLNTPVTSVINASSSKDCPLLTDGQNAWGDGNILLGGTGSDILEGRGANDIIDGDRYLNVRLSVRTDPADPGTEIGSASITSAGQSAMNSQYLRDAAGALTGATLQEAVFAGNVNPGNIVAVREIVTPTVTAADCAAVAPAVPVNCDKAVFSGPRLNYTVTVVPGVGAAGFTTVTDNVGTDGTDILRNIEVLQFADTATPGVPTGVTAVGGVGQATVSWVAPTLNRLPQVVTGYQVEVVNATSGAAFGALLPAPAAATSLLVPSLPGGSYQFRVRALNSAAAPTTGPFSIISNAVTVIAAATPGAPTAVTATAGNTTATVRWTAPASDGGSAITSYTIDVRIGGGQVSTVTNIPVGTSGTVTGLTNGTAYTFVVHAVNATGAGVGSLPSNPVTPTAPATVPGRATIGTATAGVNSATLTFTPPASNGGSIITSYSVRVLNAANTQVGALRTAPAGAATGLHTFVVTGLTTVNLPVHFTVAAVNIVGTGTASASSNTVTPRTAPGAPTIGTATRGNNSATLTWTPPASTGGSIITSYSVRVLNAANAQVGALRTAPAGATTGLHTFLVTGLTTVNLAVHFTVSAVNANGTGAPSGASNTVTPVTVPGPPVIGAAASGVAGGAVTATVNWSAPASNGGSAITSYRVFALRVNVAGAVPISTTLSALQSPTTRSLTWTTPALATGTYQFVVAAVNALGQSAGSARSALVTAR